MFYHQPLAFGTQIDNPAFNLSTCEQAYYWDGSLAEPGKPRLHTYTVIMYIYTGAAATAGRAFVLLEHTRFCS
jgi:hypothetical protein